MSGAMEPTGELGAGNTKSAPARKQKAKETKTDREVQKYLFFWTISQTVGDPGFMTKLLEPKCKWYVFQLEQGEETGYLHYQGMMSLVVKQRWSEVREWLPAESHLEPVKSYRGALEYVQKSQTRVAGPWSMAAPAKPRPKKGAVAEPESKFEKVPYPVPEKWYPWQKNLLDYVGGRPDERTVVWVYDPKGRGGKTTVVREMKNHYEGTVIGGKYYDTIYAASQRWSRLYLLLMGRDMDSTEVSYQALEHLKDGIFFSAKFKSEGVSREYMCHVVVLANCLPDKSKLTEDRWKIITL